MFTKMVTYHNILFLCLTGNYGNSLDRNMATSSSTTPPAWPVISAQSDVNREVSYMPWASSKPCCMVESSWEDCEHRIICSNVILKLSHYLVSRLWVRNYMNVMHPSCWLNTPYTGGRRFLLAFKFCLCENS